MGEGARGDVDDEDVIMFVVLSVFYWGRGDVDDEDVIMFVVLSVFYWGRGEGGVTRLFSVYLHKIRRFDNSFANLNILF